VVADSSRNRLLIEAIPAAVHSPTRVAQPMVREGWLARRPGRGEGRGRERFVPVSWDRVLDLVEAALAWCEAVGRLSSSFRSYPES
jgi:anaerobic selenocysteine-containing dehydrogenase